MQEAIKRLDQSVATEAKTEARENARMAELANAAADEEDAGRRAALLREREEARLKAYAANVEKERKAARPCRLLD